MISEIGHFALSLAFVFSVLQALVGLSAIINKGRRWAPLSQGLSLMAALSVAVAFGILVYAFIVSDFSVSNVAANSHTSKPLFYKISAVWGNHEGSMLLWNLILLSFGAIFALSAGHIPERLRLLTLGVQGLLGAGFVGFTLFASNPLARVMETVFQGKSLNPALQDPALAVHPPLHYVGYVGFSIVFSLSLAALIEGRVDQLWARYIRPWVLTAWGFLTLGIGLGGYWAYYQLGWGGWWAWDPVENVALMPWLAGTALLHSLIVLERRDSLKSWTVFLAIMTFTFSMLGAFLVRSGVLTSVHAFAVDPQRGLILLMLLFIMAGAGFALFALRAPNLTAGAGFGAISREGALLLNNVLITAALSSVFLGTLYPILMQALFDKTMSVGLPYYVMVFTPIMAAALILLPVATLMGWKKAALKSVWQSLWPVVLAALSLSLLSWLMLRPLAVTGFLSLYAGLSVGVFVVSGTLYYLGQRLWPLTTVEAVIERLKAIKPAQMGMIIAHFGLGLFVLGAVADSHARQIATAPISVGQSITINGYEGRFEGLTRLEGANFDAQGAIFVIRDVRQNTVCQMQAQRRFYPDSEQILGKVGLCFAGLDDFYVVLGDPVATVSGAPAWNIRLMFVPWIRLLFLGVLLMAIGGFWALQSSRKLKN